jgi:L-seryl-tRNA(Ser) seleniumtransferase
MNVLEELYVRPFINAYRPLTRLGGATLSKEVVDAMASAARLSVNIRVMQQRVGAAIAILTSNEAAYVSCGAASGITLAVAACMAGIDPLKSSRLPDSSGMKNEVVVHRSDSIYKCGVAIRNAGAKIALYGTDQSGSEADLRAAINNNTAAILDVPRYASPKLEFPKLVAIAQEREIPVLVDVAFGVPPRETFWRFTRDAGADAVIISGGKGIGGPQSTGLVLGKKWIVEGCSYHGSPNDRIGRGMKVGKEELAGIYAAVKNAMSQDETFLWSERDRRLSHILAKLHGEPGISAIRRRGAHAHICFDRSKCSFSPVRAQQLLLSSEPSVYVETTEDGILISTECLADEQESQVAAQLLRLFRQAL